ncbi:hypothetical protein FOMG_18147 [Fusarium oxysporum f. sp. melonis 26406]|uniref:Uncharacterized protein n=1 Tax=Fusarium oxysporum f. sp. melonis 26406 TaxID=1089452 RepID=W9Z1A4_FUSOX|nr:hypothetical protein FOMG_18147 [Fusarium oxysporum f. sp. melonis 26406]
MLSGSQTGINFMKWAQSTPTQPWLKNMVAM